MRPIAITGMEATDGSIRHPKFVGGFSDLYHVAPGKKIFGVINESLV